MAKITGVHHIAIKPTKETYAKTVDFYMNILGFAKVKSWGDAETPCLMLSCGDNTVMEVLVNTEVNHCGEGSVAHIAFACEEVDEMVEKVREAGYEITIEPKDVTIGCEPPYPVRIAFCQGPINEVIEFFKEY